MKTVLLTGATGFIGSQSIPPLREAGYEVHAITSRAAPPPSEGVGWHTLDLFDSAAVHALCARVKPTHLLHFAWYVEHGAYWTSPENLRWVSASLDLLRAFAENGGGRAALAGTCAEYDWDYGYCSEGVTPLASTSLYSASKVALGSLLASYAAQVNLSAAWGRIFYPYGAGEHPSRLIPSVITALLKNQPAPISHGEQLRDWLYVADVARAFVALLDSPVTDAVNIGSGVPVSIRDVVYQIGAKLGRPDLIQIGALPARPDDPPLLAADVRRLKHEVQWQTRYSLDAGLDAAIDWWRSTLGSMNE